MDMNYQVSLTQECLETHETPWKPTKGQFKKPEAKSIHQMNHKDLNTYLHFLTDKVNQ